VESGAHGGCDQSAEDVYSSSAYDPAFAFFGGPYCPTLDFVITFWIVVTLYTLTSLFYILSDVKDAYKNRQSDRKNIWVHFV
jgi:hypothetical protein